MPRVTVTHIVSKVATYFSTPAVVRRHVMWRHDYSHEQKQGFVRRRKSYEKYKMEKESKIFSRIWYRKF